MNFTRNVENACKKGYDKENKRWYSMAVASGGAGGAAAPPPDEPDHQIEACGLRMGRPSFIFQSISKHFKAPNAKKLRQTSIISALSSKGPTSAR